MFKLELMYPISFIPGNHDIGLGQSASFSPLARKRYTSHFAPLNSRISLANHTLVLLDAPDLVDEERRHDAQPYTEWNPIAGSAFQFVQSVAMEIKEPVILCSHIPLWRPAGSSCGPHREKGTIRQGFGLGYQNELGPQVTQFLLDTLKPSLILR